VLAPQSTAFVDKNPRAICQLIFFMVRMTNSYAKTNAIQTNRHTITNKNQISNLLIYDGEQLVHDHQKFNIKVFFFLQ